MARKPSGALTFPFPEPPAPGESMEILPGLHWVRMPLPLKLDHVNVWVVDDGDALTIIDTGIADERTPALLRQVRAGLPRRPVSRVLITHHHPDHCGLADRLVEEHGAELLISSLAHEAGLILQHREKGTDAKSTAASLAKYGLSPTAQRFLVDHEHEFDMLKPGIPPDFTPLAEGDTVGLGDYSCRVIFGQGHAPDHVCLYCAGGAAVPAARGESGDGPARSAGADGARHDAGGGTALKAGAGFLISGDMLLPDISTHVGSPAAWLPGNPVAQFQKSVRRFAALPAGTLVLPSHGVPFYGIRERVAELEVHHEQRCATMAAALGGPRSAAELLDVVFQRELDALQLMFAMNEAVAHLEYMADRGQLERLEGEDGIVRYVRKGAG
jgi:glyoxylase-like metal-dependent hydrolase (beta-lactamase superfamily II)